MSKRRAVPAPPKQCPCGLGELYGDCCGKFHHGPADPPTAELAMRARYSAYVVGDSAFLLRSWHERTRPRMLALDSNQRWAGLDILERTGGGLFDAEGTVEFKAHFVTDGTMQTMHERSRFVRSGGAWLYVDEV